MAAASIRLLVLENIFLIPSHDIYLLVGAYIKYRVAKMVQGRVIGKVIYLFLRLTFLKSCLLTKEATPHVRKLLFVCFQIVWYSCIAVLELTVRRDGPRILIRLNAIVWLCSSRGHRHLNSLLKQQPKTY